MGVKKNPSNSCENDELKHAMLHEFVIKMPCKIAITNTISKLLCQESPCGCQMDIWLLLVVRWWWNSTIVGKCSSS